MRDDEIRSLVVTALADAAARPGSRGPRYAAVVGFLETLAPGQRARARELHVAFLAWARVEAPAQAGITGTAFGRLAMASGRVERSRVGAGKVYTMLGA